MTPTPPVKPVYTLLVEVGRKTGDGLPAGATGAGLLCYATGQDEAEAVRETVAILKEAGLAPLDVTGYGTLEERLSEGHEIADEERALMARAVDEDAVIVAQFEPIFAKPSSPEHKAAPGSSVKIGAGTGAGRRRRKPQD